MSEALLSVRLLSLYAVLSAGALAFFAYHLLKMHSDWEKAFDNFKERYYPDVVERVNLGNKQLNKSFNQYVFGFYVFGGFSAVLLYLSLSEIFEKVI